MPAAVAELSRIVLVMLLGAVASFGGGPGPMAVIQGTWVESGRLDAALFAWVIALSHVTPGPKAGFIAGIGYYLQGFPGAVAAMTGVLLPTWVGAAVAARGLDRFRRMLDRLKGAGLFVVAGLMAGTALGTALPMSLNGLEVAAVILVAWLVGWRGADPLWVVLASVGIGLGWTWIA